MPWPWSKPDPRRLVATLLRENAVSDGWRANAAALGLRTTRGQIIQSHPVINRLYRLAAGWADDARTIPLAATRPTLRGIDLAALMNFDLNTEDTFHLAGPDSDFDPANSVPFAWAASESIWYSVLTLPGTPMARWPVVQCEPSGNNNVVPIALDVAGFIRDWFGGAGPYTLGPSSSAPEDQAHALIDALAQDRLINPKAARRADAAARQDKVEVPGLKPAVDPDLLRPLRSLVVDQDE